MLEVILVTPVVLLFEVLDTFALVLHKFPLLLDESLSASGFDDAHYAAQAYSFMQWSGVRPCRSPNEQRMVVVGRPR